jgi:hypothetical protein
MYSLPLRLAVIGGRAKPVLLFSMECHGSVSLSVIYGENLHNGTRPVRYPADGKNRSA